jgi:hypothetical protein
MSDDKTLVLTEAAEARLQRLYAALRDDIERELRARNFVPGDKSIEVTASDVDQLAHSMRIFFLAREVHKARWYRRAAGFYTGLGAGATLAGLFLPNLREVVANPVQAALIAMGVITFFVGLVFTYRVRSRDRELDELTQIRLFRSGLTTQPTLRELNSSMHEFSHRN